MIAEGALFAVDTAVDVPGLVGTPTATIHWGDGSSSPAEVTGGPETGAIRIRLDYSLDTSGFFTGANASRRARLQAAADTLAHRLLDDLDAITPSGKAQWVPAVFHPSRGAANSLAGDLVDVATNLRVAANEIVVYVGARNLPGNTRGVGGTGSYRLPAVSNLSPAELQQVLRFRDTVASRGEPGALANPRTDVAPWGGSVSFDTDTNWYFGADADRIQHDQVDFLTVATHELAHVLGFGMSRPGVTTSWDRLAGASTFNGPQARAEYRGSGNVPIVGSHWKNSALDLVGQSALMSESILTGSRQPLTNLDLAALDDIGWETDRSPIRVAATHRFADDGIFPVRVSVLGSRGSEVWLDQGEVTVDNVAPALTVPGHLTATAGVPISITDIVSITDRGFRNLNATPATGETFRYAINWGDGSPWDEGDVRIDSHGNAQGNPTKASANGSHRYDMAKTYRVFVTVTDDDGGSTTKNFLITVQPPPELRLALDVDSIDEAAGADAATLTVTRSGAVSETDLTVTLDSNDPSEARLVDSIVIRAGETSATASVSAVDDALLDGDVTVQLSAEASGTLPATIDLIVADRETLSARFSADTVREDSSGSVTLTVTRHNVDIQQPLVVQLAGAGLADLGLDSEWAFDVGQATKTVPLMPVDDGDAEPDFPITLLFTADGYVDAGASVTLVDDEPPQFQNIADHFDVNNSGEATAVDALLIINELSRRGGAAGLIPSESPETDQLFVDVNGDYLVTALDALLVVNELTRRANRASEAEQVSGRPIDALADADEDRRWIWFGLDRPS